MTIKRIMYRTVSALVFLVPLAACTRAPAPLPEHRPAGAPSSTPRGTPIQYTDLRAQTVEFIGYYKTIQLTPQQEKIKTEALSSIPAPCCAEFSAATCCCPCNLSKSLWGLSHYLIAREGRGVDEVKSAALRWIAFIQPNGSSGRACSTGGCSRPFSKDGCGGMDDTDLRL